MRFLGYLFFTSLILLSESGYSAEQSRVLESTRAYGRGGTYVAAYDSDEAVYLNPATLAEVSKELTWQLRLGQLDVFIGENTITTISDLMSMSSSSTLGVLESLTDKFGQRQYARGQYVPFALRILSFEMSPFVSSTNFAEARLPTTPDMEFMSDTLMGMNFSLGLEGPKGMAYGLTVRPMQRYKFSGGFSFGDLLDLVDDSSMSMEDVFEQTEGFYIGVDLGFTMNPTKELRYGATIENLGYAGNQNSGSNSAGAIPQRINAGMNYRKDMKPWHLDLSLDVQDIANPNNYNYFRLIHMGSEFGTNYFTRDNDIGLLAGFNEGYFTTGAYVDFWFARFGATYYAVELGEYPGQRKDRRWAFTLQTSITF